MCNLPILRIKAAHAQHLVGIQEKKAPAIITDASDRRLCLIITYPSVIPANRARIHTVTLSETTDRGLGSIKLPRQSGVSPALYDPRCQLAQDRVLIQDTLILIH